MTTRGLEKPKERLNRLYMEAVSANSAQNGKNSVENLFHEVLHDKELAFEASKEKKYLEVMHQGASLAHIISPSASHAMIMNMIRLGDEVTGMKDMTGCSVRNVLSAHHGKKIDKMMEIYQLEKMLRIGKETVPAYQIR
ncbi:MAG: hypothetical protein KGI06_05620 [Candidatus Micrarchaeota archaeon]|nr:hypothetical protein [Candidatus Micrarchaeota archaeon]